MNIKTIQQDEASGGNIPISEAKRMETFQTIRDMRTLFACLICGPISLEYCKETLKIENPIPIIRALNELGVKAKLDINTSNIYIDQGFHLGFVIVNRFITQVRKLFWLRALKSIAENHVGSDSQRSSEIVDCCIFVREKLTNES